MVRGMECSRSHGGKDESERKETSKAADDWSVTSITLINPLEDSQVASCF